jgi:putative ABC transport system substrate-binding protein
MLSLWFGTYDQGLAYAGLALGTLLTLRILKGESPATMPFEPLTTTTLLLNGATAQAIGVSLPQALLQQADKLVTP